MPLKLNLRDIADDARRRIAEIDHDELASMREDAAGPSVIVIDVREGDERARGHIPGSIHIARGVIERDIEKRAFGCNAQESDLARPIVLYCAGGNRSLLAGDMLRQMGFSNVVSLAGGFGAWAEAGRPVEIDRR